MTNENTTLAMIARVRDDKELHNLTLALRGASAVAMRGVLVLDNSSLPDNQIECAIPRTLSCRVFRREWTDDFSAARNFALSYVTSKWTLVLDADEQIVNAPHWLEAIEDADTRGGDSVLVVVKCITDAQPTSIHSVRVHKTDGMHWKYPIHNQLVGFRDTVRCDKAKILTSYRGAAQDRAERSRGPLEKMIASTDRDEQLHGRHYLQKTHVTLRDWQAVINLGPTRPWEDDPEHDFWHAFAWLAVGAMESATGQIDRAIAKGVKRGWAGYPPLHWLAAMCSLAMWEETAKADALEHLTRSRIAQHNLAGLERARQLLGMIV